MRKSLLTQFADKRKVKKMKKWLLNINKITSSVKDPSELYTFTQESCKFLRVYKDASFLKKIIEPVKLAIYSRSFRKASIGLNIAAEINNCSHKRSVNCLLIIDMERAKTLLLNNVTRDHSLLYFASLRVSSLQKKLENYFYFLDSIIKPFIDNQSFSNECNSAGLYRYMKLNPSILKEFLYTNDPALCKKQLAFIRNTGVFFSMDWNVQWLADESKIICHWAFEVFDSLLRDRKAVFEYNLEDLVKDDEDFIKSISECEICKEKKFNEGLGTDYTSIYMKIGKIPMRDPVNFIKFAWSFLPERAKIIHLVLSCDKQDGLNEIIQKYSLNPVKADFRYMSIKDLVFNKEDRKMPETCTEELGDFFFGHLFKAENKKSCCDCPEF